MEIRVKIYHIEQLAKFIACLVDEKLMFTVETNISCWTVVIKLEN